ncbi:hypothetical protein N2152v2_007613 [Parachlorella kessleri]
MEEPVIEQRLAAATATPPSQRSPEVAAFIECCQLQRELAEEQRQGANPARQQEALAALKLAKSNASSPAVALWYQPAVYEAALERVLSAARMKKRFKPRPARDPATRILALANSDFSIRTLLLVAAAAPAFGGANISGLLPVYNSIVERMQRPAESAKLRPELGQLQSEVARSLLSYEQLLAYFIKLASNEAAELMANGGCGIAAHIDAAYRAQAELVPKLVPDALHRQFFSLMAAEVQGAMLQPPAYDHCQQTIRNLAELLERAQQQDSDFTVALCGYQLASLCPDYGAVAHKKQLHQQQQQQAAHLQGSSAGLPAHGGVVPPSAFLGWLKQARRAHARCQATLPKQWTVGFERRQQAPLVWKSWLQGLQREGDRWQLPSTAQANQVDAQTVGYAAVVSLTHAAGTSTTGCPPWGSPTGLGPK